MRTLVISDLHLGAHTHRDVLRRPEPLAQLLDGLGGYERLVLLGDTLELRHGPARDALASAEPVLRAIGGAIGEVVIVPGNHDHHLAAPWLARRCQDAVPPRLELENTVDHRPGEALDTIAAWLAPANVRGAYPGVWLRDDVYAIHGHYADRHTTVPMFERLGAGAMARIAHEPDGGPATVEDYENVLAPLYAWMHQLAQGGGLALGRSSHGASAQAWRALAKPAWRRSARAHALGVALPALLKVLNRAGLGPLRSDISGPGLRRASLDAIGEVVRRLGIGAEHVVFGHTHRAGPRAPDSTSEWNATKTTHLHNTGCWVYEPGFVNPPPDRGPYWPGHAIEVESAGAPVLRAFLENLQREQLIGPSRA